MKFILQILSVVFSPAPIEFVRIQLAYSRIRLLKAENECENADSNRELLKTRIARLEQRVDIETATENGAVVKGHF